MMRTDRDPDGVPAQESFDSGRFVIAILKAHDSWRSAPAFSKTEKIGIGRDDRETIGFRVLPDSLV
jgi:hypothetical protein